MHNVLVIRPLNEAQHLSDLLNSKNVKSTLYPLFKPNYIPLPSLEKPQAFIITSINALQVLEDRDDLKSVPLYVVGAYTASHAKKIGFTNVFATEETSHELIRNIEALANRDKGQLIYLSGEKVTGRMVETLTENGFNAKRQIVYKIEDATDLPIPLVKDLKDKTLSHVMFFSSRTTSVFVNLLRDNGLSSMTSKMVSLCFSQNVAKQAEELVWDKIWISPKPNIQAMIRYFDD